MNRTLKQLLSRNHIKRRALFFEDHHSSFPVSKRCLTSRSNGNGSTSASNNPLVHTTSDLDETPSTSSLEKILRAPVQRVDNKNSLLTRFPWRHEPEYLPRLVVGSEAFEEKGFLLGGNVISSNALFDAFATAWMFLDVPWYKMLFFQHWQADMAENMSWAFSQGVAGILSNVYRVPMDDISNGDSNFQFIHAPSIPTEEEESSSEEKEKNDGGADLDRAVVDSTVLNDMVEGKLRELFESAHQNGKNQMEVRLECHPVGGARMVNLFVFPFLSRNTLKREPGLKGTYRKLLELMVVSPSDALPIYQELVAEFYQRGSTESTVLCQVLVPCDEIFWVKDLATGAIVQGHEDGQLRRVYHLVRMEMVIESVPKQKGLYIIPFQNRHGNWQITDIDDLLEGNLLL